MKGNTRETGIGKTSAVGLFPEGASAYGVQDLSGNVWEWCLTTYAEGSVGSDDATGAAARVLRGGAWDDFADDARACSRVSSVPYYGYGGVGFRVCVSAPLKI